jgi:hypothetical protein
MRGLNVTWDEANLEEWLQGLGKFVRGTKMIDLLRAGRERPAGRCRLSEDAAEITCRSRPRKLRRSFVLGSRRWETNSRLFSLPASLMPDKGWQRRFDEPIVLPSGRKLVTLHDAATYATELPEAKSAVAEWQAEIEAPMLVADLGGPTMFARIACVTGTEPPLCSRVPS